jgi:precorrin-2 dehydrogenase
VRRRTLAPGAPPLYPIALDLRRRSCLVVGGGSVAERKVDGLLAVGARVTVVSPALTDRLCEWIERGQCRHIARAYRSRDVRGHAIVLVATGDDRVTARVCRDARRAGALVNAADDPERCDFFLPAIVRRGRLTVAVSTSGASPALASAVRDELEQVLPQSYAALLEVFAEVRARVRRHAGSVPAARWRRALDDRLRTLVAHGHVAEATALLWRRLVERRASARTAAVAG